jgi:LPXTG-motif cell wall-anchored protein
LPAAEAAPTLASTGLKNYFAQVLVGFAFVAVIAGALLLWTRRRLKRVS